VKKQTIELNKYTAAYTSIGEGIPVILLHGFFGDSSTLEAISGELPDKYCRINLDLLGFGDSSKPQIRYLVEHQVEFLQEFIAAKNISKFYLVGYSYGAWVAAAYAIEMADKLITMPNLNGIVLLAPAGIRDDSFVGRYDYLKPLLWETPLVEVALNAIAPLARSIGKAKTFDSIIQARKSIVSQPVAKSLLVDRLKAEDAVDTVEQDIDRITTSTLVIAGEIDRHIPLWHSQTYVEKIPNASLDIIPGADHDLVETHYSEVVKSIVKYWDRSDA
jgi:pimeloyl-ACP methyl ester carboxylesterase